MLVSGSMKKGITPVVAVILLLLITIAMVGFAFVWFSRVVQSAGSAGEESLQSQLDQQGKRVKIDNAAAGAGSTITIRNIGTRNIQPSEIVVYINNALVTCTVPSAIAPGGFASCDPSTDCVAGQKVRVTAPGGVDETTCE